MESNNSEQEEKLEDNDEHEQQPNKQNNANNNTVDNIQEDPIFREKKIEKNQASTSKNECVSNLKERTKAISNKLSKKRQKLQQQQVKALNDKSSIEDNDEKVLTALQSMATKTIITREKGNQKLIDDVPHGSMKYNKIQNEHVKKPLNKYTKNQLVNMVEGLQELVCKLTMDDKKLKQRALRLTNSITSLKEFPVLDGMLTIKASTSSGSRQRFNSSYYADDTIRGSDDRRHCSESEVVEKKKRAKSTPVEIFNKYINSILMEFLDIQNFPKYRCPSSLTEDSLEKYAMVLVEGGFGCIAEGEIRINRKNNHQAFIAMSSDRETTERDAIIMSTVGRCYAFEGDTVRAFVFKPVESIDLKEYSPSPKFEKPRNISNIDTENLNNSISLTEGNEQFETIDKEILAESELDTTAVVESDNCRKAFVINIVKRKGSTEFVGSISFANTTTISSKSFYKIKPHDMTLPMIYIPQESCKNEIESAGKEDVCDMLYVAKVIETDENGYYIGNLLQPVGTAGKIQDEIKAILLQNGFKDLKPYEQKFDEMYAGPIPPPTEDDLKNREDLRKKCIFTIDPLTAKDLDDAVSVEKMNEDQFEIGVHISDVSYYLTENSELDNLVKHRATSIYLVNNVIHMLPPSLCSKCSLLPGKDKFAFSVFWRWHTKKEEIGSPRFTRSIINSCSQFAYEHAQKIIDNPNEEFDQTDFPEILNEWTADDIKERILFLHHIAQKLKARRYESGALSINNPKLRFNLDPSTGEPLSCEVECRKEANFLIEELMLLANRSVADFIYSRFPKISILRNHAPPLKKSMKALKERLSNLKLEFDITSSRTIYESMQRLSCQSKDPKAVEACLNALLTKPMVRAKYICSEGITDEREFLHYALSIPKYTHFTSPIRRYPDILVHRLLAAALNYCQPPQRTTDELHDLVKICNDQKFNAKNAGDASIEFFFKRFVKANQPLTSKAVVTDIYNHMLNVVTIETGQPIVIKYNMQDVQFDTSNVPSYVLVSEKNSETTSLKLQLFSTVNINLMIKDGTLCGVIVLSDLEQKHINCQESKKGDKHANDIRKRVQNKSVTQKYDNSARTSSNSKNKQKFGRQKNEKL